MSPFTFKEHEKLGDASNFSTWKVRYEIIDNNNDVMEYIQGCPSLQKMPPLPSRIGTRKVSQKQSKL